MTKKFCKQCGNALTKAGAKFCTTCGATVGVVEPVDVTAQETRPLPGEQTDQTVYATEVLPESKASSYATEEMPITATTSRAEERATEVIADAFVTQSRPKRVEPAPANQPSVQPSGGPAGRLSGGRKKLASAAALGGVALVALAAGTFFFIHSRRAPEAQAEMRTADNAKPSTSAQPIAQQSNQQSNQQSGAGANNQAQLQTGPQPGPSISEVRSPAVHNSEAGSNPQRQAVAKPTPATPQEKPAADGTSAEHSLEQGITYMNAGRHQEALQEFEQVKKLDPDNKNIYYLIGQTYQRMNQLQQALEAYRQCTSGHYASVAQNAVKKLEKKVGKVNAR